MAKTSDSDKILAFLCYPLWPVGVVLLLMERKDLRFHSLNGIGFGVAWLVVSMLLSVLLWIFWPVLWLVNVAAFIYAILLGLKAYNGEKPEIPLVTDLLRKNVKGL